MTRKQNAQKLRQELEKSGNVESVEVKDEYQELKPKYIEQTLEVEFTDKGFSFELIRQKFPTMRVEDIHYNNGISAILKVHEVTE